MSSETQAAPKRRRWLPLLPLAVFLALAGVFSAQLLSGRDSSVVPSALLGAPAPDDTLPPLVGMNLPGLDPSSFDGQVTLVNVWASWCAPCRQEHPLLLQLAGDERFEIVGLNYKDRPDNARRFLGELGNPYSAIGVDDTGRAAIDWGVYGVPETFLVGKDGRIAWKQVGPFTPEIVVNTLLPEIEKALAVR
ncbi:DsbE family thiol:disulfide interchange protein [Mesorhizobium sp. CAU 1741]|uniref:DsbE family thiol:disulfide interchange protein n=1 Tax=Mesorhizobium sp. CAU 1741 TaxID=3140366 RepID=UPI00325BBFED